MAKLFCSFDRFVRNIDKSKYYGIASDRTSFLFLKKLMFTDYGVSKYFATLHSIDPDDSVPTQTSNYSILTEGNSESRQILIAKKLVDILKIEYSEASRLILSNPVLIKVGSANISKSVQAAEKVGILKEILLKYPWILSKPAGEIKHAANLLEIYRAGINETAPLLGIPMYQLAIFNCLALADQKIIPQKSRVLYFSETLEFDILKTCEALSKHNYLFTLPFERIDAIMRLLLDANILKMDIISDLWIFRHCIKTIKHRIEMTREGGIERVKPWMLRCSDKTIATTINRYTQNKALLGSHPSVASYLMERLNCSEEEISYILRRCPVIEKTNLPKLQTIIDYLYAEGYTSEQIVSTPRVLTHKYSTLKSRVEELRTLGYNLKPLMKLCLAQRPYEKFINNLSE